MLDHIRVFTQVEIFNFLGRTDYRKLIFEIWDETGTNLIWGCTKMVKIQFGSVLKPEKLNMEISQNWITLVWEYPKIRKTQFGNVPKL